MNITENCSGVRNISHNIGIWICSADGEGEGNE